MTMGYFLVNMGYSI